MTLSRRSLITGLISFVVAPAIVKVSNLMPVKVMQPSLSFGGVPVEFDSSGLFGAECIYFQDRICWISPSDRQTVIFSEPMDKSTWDDFVSRFDRSVLR